MTHPNIHRFLIVRLGSLGDVIHGIPVAAALRERYPFARIDWMVDPRYVELLGLVRGLNAAIPVDPRRRLRSLMATIRGLRRVRYTAAVDLQGLLKSAVLARLAGAWQTIGLTREHLREPMARTFYTDMADPGAHTHVVFKNLSLLKPLGIRDARPSFPLAIPDSAAVDAARDSVGADEYVLLNPGAAWPNKRWPADRFGELAAALRDANGLRSLVLWGPGEERLASSVVDASRGAAVLSPPTAIVDMFALAASARLVVSGDTGPLHIAAAAGTPVVALFGPTLTERNGPWLLDDITVSRTAQCKCLYQRRCRIGQPCINEIELREVLEAVQERLRRPDARLSNPDPRSLITDPRSLARVDIDE
jgi:lipopolysaccharide heptosyltransferase I